MREFAESEIIIPDGPFKNQLFACYRQPFTSLWFAAVEAAIWNRFFSTGPSQTGKSLLCFIIPILYHLFEVGETVVVGVPSMEIAADKWREDIKPAIERSRYRDLLPTTGQGSKGGMPEAVRFNNGATLRFMSGGGDDKSRSAFTARVLVITEVDGMDEAGEKSREADKIEQLEARTRAFGKGTGQRRLTYAECTVSVEEGRTWDEYTKGTASKIVLPCQKCGVFVHPTRESLVGWQSAETEFQAEEMSSIHCPECGEAWSETERRRSNENGVLVHRGQEIEPNGTIHGPLPQTNTLGFRWDAINNLFVTPGEIGVEEWKASRATDEENAEKKMRQFIWALPHEPSALDSTPLDAAAIINRVAHAQKGFIPPWCEAITVGVDVGKWLFHWVAVAWAKDCSRCHVFDYGRHDVASKELGEERAVLQALRELQGIFTDGWQVAESKERRSPNAVWIDAGYLTDVVYGFIRETANKAYMPCDGLGTAQENRTAYNRPKTTGAIVKVIGEGWHFSYLPAKRVTLAEINADQWKSWAHARLTTPLENPGALTLYKSTPVDHLALAKQLTAERQVEEFIAGKGVVTKWVRDRRNNHWFDSLYYGCAAGSACGVQLVKPMVRKPDRPMKQPEEPSRIRQMNWRR